jgi:GTPase
LFKTFVGCRIIVIIIVVNALLKRERVLTGPTPGVTRDAISIEWSWEGRPVQLVDTAGMIRLHSNYKGGQSLSSSSSVQKVRVDSSSHSSLSLNTEFAGDSDVKALERQNIQIQDMAVKDALRAMKMTDVAVLVLDAGAKRLHRRELALAKAVLDEGRALVIAANKMDLVVQKAPPHYRRRHDDDDDDEEDDDDVGSYTKSDFARDVREQLESRFPMLRQTPIVPMSSLSGEGVEDLMPVVFRARDRWARTISTGALNRWLEDVVMMHQQSSVTHETNKIKYIMQTKGRPPTFLLFLNGSRSTISDSTLRFLTRQLQDSFQMYGMNVRLVAKNSSKDSDIRPKRKRSGSGLGGHEARKKRTIKLLQTTGQPKKQRRKAKRR